MGRGLQCGGQKVDCADRRARDKAAREQEAKNQRAAGRGQSARKIIGVRG
jgi:hypothetical protein